MRIYTRDTKTWKLLGWEAQAVMTLLARRFDRAGLVDDVYNGEDVAVMIGYGFPVETAEKGLRRLLEKNVWTIVEDGLFWPNFADAQEASQSDAQRARTSREKRKAKARLDASQNVTCSHKTNENVTARHSASQRVTLTRTVPNCAENKHIFSSTRVESDKTSLSESNRRDIEVVKDPTAKKIDALVTDLAGECYDPLDGPAFAVLLRESYCKSDTDIDAILEQIRTDVAARGLALGCWRDVKTFVNGKARDYSRRYKLKAEPGRPDAATVGYNAMKYVEQCIDRGLAIDPDKLVLAYNTAVEDGQRIPLSVTRLVDKSVSSGWVERRPGSGKIERAAHYVTGETAETLSSPRVEATPEEIRRICRESLKTGGAE